jgi:hypothetical protein
MISSIDGLRRAYPWSTSAGPFEKVQGDEDDLTIAFEYRRERYLTESDRLNLIQHRARAHPKRQKENTLNRSYIETSGTILLTCIYICVHLYV